MKELKESDIEALARKLGASLRERRKKVTVDVETYEALLALSKSAIKDGKLPDRTLFNITIEDNDDHVQVYRQDKNAIIKLGNIYRIEGGTYEADAAPYPKVKWGNFTRALAYLISPRGMT
jgi:hypothetical protein